MITGQACKERSATPPPADEVRALTAVERDALRTCERAVLGAAETFVSTSYEVRVQTMPASALHHAHASLEGAIDALRAARSRT